MGGGKSGGSIGKIFEIDIDLPEYPKRGYKRSTSKVRSKKPSRAARKGISDSKSVNRHPDAKNGTTTAAIKPKRTKGEPGRNATTQARVTPGSEEAPPR